MSRGDSVAFGHLEDRIVKLVEKLDASDSRLGHLEAIERGLADLLVHIEDMRANKDAGGLRAQEVARRRSTSSTTSPAPRMRSKRCTARSAMWSTGSP